MYFYDLWSACHGIKRLLRKSVTEIEEARRYFVVPPEERLAKHKPLLALVSAEETPVLFSKLKSNEEMRVLLLKSLALFIEVANENNVH